MNQESGGAAREQFSMVDPRVMDPDGETVNRMTLSDEIVADTVAVLNAMNLWRDTERSMSESSRRYMRLGDSDMRALRFLLASERHGVIATPGSIASHLGVSAAAITKLLDRLATAGHITRESLPGDRRSIGVHVTDETRASARASVGRSHARRFDAVASLSPDDRAAVLRFFNALMETAEWVPEHPPSEG